MTDIIYEMILWCFAPIITHVPSYRVPRVLRIVGVENGIWYHKKIYNNKPAIAVRRRQYHVHYSNRFMTE